MLADLIFKDMLISIVVVEAASPGGVVNAVDVQLTDHPPAQVDATLTMFRKAAREIGHRSATMGGSVKETSSRLP